jgi:hypothetical protein
VRIAFAIPGFPTDSNSVGGQRVRSIVSRYVPHIGKASYSRPGHIVFSVVDAFDTRSTAKQNAIALEALLRCLVELNLLWLQNYPLTPTLYDSGVFYARTVIWDTIPALYARGFGDCKSLTAARIAELLFHYQVQTVPVFRFDTQPDGTMFHILVMMLDGLNEDPSKILGMVPPQELASANMNIHTWA